MLKLTVKCFCLLLALTFVLCSCTAIQKTMYPLRYRELILKYSEQYDIPKDLLSALINAESGFDPEAKSSAGAVGLMQLLPTTAEEMAGRMGIEYKEETLTDPETNISYGAYYLSYLNKYVSSDWETVCAAYNAGFGRVSGWLADERYSDDGVSLKTIPFEETKNYVNKIKKSRAKYLELYFSEEGEDSK
ncbi:MAG: lytic transglycosylase domain-containing protein [Clostridia bacterium]|nr:lytic transglycosylase domain-containing protein [Clostridia bacterium]